MKFNSLKPILWTDKLDETLDFYQNILGFQLLEINDDWGWAVLQKDDIDIMFAKPNQQKVFIKPNFTGSFYLNVKDVEEIWEKLKNKVTICYDLEIFDWGMKEFAIYDNNGYILQFGEELSNI